MSFAADLESVQRALAQAKREGRDDDADALIMTNLPRLFEQLVVTLGRDDVRRAVRHQAGAAGPVLPEQLTPAGTQGDGRLARALIFELLAIGESALDQGCFEMLAGAVLKGGKGGTVTTVLDLDRPSHVRGDPTNREQAIMATCAVAGVLFTAARGGGSGEAIAGWEAEAHARLKHLGVNAPKPGSLEFVERRLLDQANNKMTERTWQRTKSEIPAEVRVELGNLLRLIAGGELTPDQHIMGSDPRQATLDQYARLAGFRTPLDTQLTYIRELWRRSRPS